MSIFSDGQISWDWDDVTVSTMAYGYLSAYKRAGEGEDDSSTQFDNFLRKTSNGIFNAAQKLVYIAENKPENSHDYYSDWADPFEEDCFELQSEPLPYD